MAKKSTKRRIMYICSLPKNMPMLRFIHEISQIQDHLLEGKEREKYIFSPKIGVRPTRLDRVILGKGDEISPYILHFSTHASKSEGLIMANEKMERECVPFSILEDYITELIQNPGCDMSCVIFNCCHSFDLAQSISPKIEYVMGTKGAIPDDACVAFSRTFYACLFDGDSIQDAYLSAKKAVRRWKIKEAIEDEEGEELYEERFVLFKNGKIY